MLRLVGIYVHNRMQDLCKPERAERKIKLTPRECDCLKWASDGKSSWEISQILVIAHYTADWYPASASKKLQAVNRRQAVAEALRQGFIV